MMNLNFIIINMDYNNILYSVVFVPVVVLLHTIRASSSAGSTTAVD